MRTPAYTSRERSFASLRRSARDHDFPWTRYVHDTKSGEDIRGIAHAEDGALVSWHVTDRPRELIAFLKRRGRLVRAFGAKGRTAELGPGLYLGNPQFWSGRSTDKWDFLRTISPAALSRLLETLDTHVRQQRERGYITESEYERALKTMDRVARGIYQDGAAFLVDLLANQPYNISFWRPEFLKPLGIAPSPPPSTVEVRFRGRFAELEGSYPPRSVLRTLRRAGLQGAFTRAAMSSNAELVIWDPNAILSAKKVDA